MDKSYHKQATCTASETDHGVTVFAGCCCPFVHCMGSVAVPRDPISCQVNHCSWNWHRKFNIVIIATAPMSIRKRTSIVLWSAYKAGRPPGTRESAD
ncbi:hypothetical protein M404DRAFT_805593 [Pisolithus tinctorius Marx 270]|uniref:Uncharacterized protein n=1 Tax=Pisolithus tinctorius Marx 270 TaxID=870435 RepID=A0A0C3PDS1_PISTI|nr:hypothetical protein M404DRAFT_805593 [Pisolithus tinctorius Marx 270]